MKFNFLKLKKDNLPPLKSLRPPIFNIDLFWFLSLGLCFLVLAIAALIGFRLAYSQYSESYKESGQTENYEESININRLKSAIEKRNEFISQQISLPRDPSL